MSREKEIIGAKAASLEWLDSFGVAVPEWTAIPAGVLNDFLKDLNIKVPSADDDEGIQEVHNLIMTAEMPSALKTVIESLALPLLEKGSLAVRSSGTLEDMASASFAGQYESVLDVKTVAELIVAVRQCWASQFTERVFQYCSHQGLDVADLQMAVIVQQLVPAVSAGVAFSVDPIHGRDDIVLIEAIRGLGEALVSGQVDPDRFYIDWRNDTVIESTYIDDQAPVLTESEVLEIAQLTVKVQAEYGAPVDIEWAKSADKIWLVQTRPVTDISNVSVEGEWTTADFKDGGVSASVCTPFMSSLYDRSFTVSCPEYFDRVGLVAPQIETQPWYMVRYGRPYWNAGHVKKRLEGLPGYKERSFDEDLGIRVSYEGDGVTTGFTPKTMIRGISVLGKLNKSFKQCLATQDSVLGRLDTMLLARENIMPSELSDEELACDYRKLIEEDYADCELTYFSTIYDNSNSQTLFQERLDRIFKKTDLPNFQPLDLLGGLKDISHLRPVFEEAAVVKAIRTDVELTKEFLAMPTAQLLERWQAGREFPAVNIIRPFISKWAWLAPRTLEILQARWREDPSPVFDSIKRALQSNTVVDVSTAEITQIAAYERARKICHSIIAKGLPILSAMSRKSFDEALHTTRSLLWLREELRMHSTRMYSLIRTFTLELGNRWQQRGAIDVAEDIFFLEAKDILNFLTNEPNWPEVRRSVKKAQLYYHGYKNYINPDEIGSRWSSASMVLSENTPQLSGVGGSAGTYQGTARLIHEVEEVGRLEPGDILITKFTDPGWTTAFAELGAVVTETGGVLSHAAVISREYGFPAVLAVQGAMSTIKDGEQIIVNGTAGTVHRVDAS
jgi:pyruvate,water dikinase